MNFIRVGGPDLTSHRELYAASRRFAWSDNRRAWVELCATFVLYVAAMATALVSIGAWWIVAPAVVVAAAMGLRIYMIQHDCLHRSFFTSRKVNDVVGTLLSPIAMTPYKATRYIHGQHHTYVSDLDHREAFEIYTMTLDEWHAASWWEKLQYRLYRSPITLIFLGPFVLYTVLRRMPLYGLKTGIGDLVLHNLLLAAYVMGVYWIAGWPGIGVWLASVYVACATGALIPYVVHNFEHILWGTRPDLTFESAALDGSAVLDWGRLFDVVTMNIGYHDLHHLNAKIPGYHLREAHQALESEGFLRSHKISFWEGIRCMRWKLYDEQKQCMIPFSAASKAAGAVPAE